MPRILKFDKETRTGSTRSPAVVRSSRRRANVSACAFSFAGTGSAGPKAVAFLSFAESVAASGCAEINAHILPSIRPRRTLSVGGFTSTRTLDARRKRGASRRSDMLVLQVAVEDGGDRASFQL